MLYINAIRNILLNNSKHFTITPIRKINIIASVKCNTPRFLSQSSKNISIVNTVTTFIGYSTFFNSFKLLLKLRKMSGEPLPKVVFVLGGPGAGKGTQCQKIVDNFGFIHLSAGDLLREERSREGSEYGELIEDCIKNGKIVPVEVTCSLLENAMNKIMKAENKYKFLIDGFPRNQDNLDGWNRKMADKVQLLFVLFFDCSENICIERCLNRGKSGSGRSDDNLESLKKRIQTYENDSLPIIEYYKKLNLVKRIDASPDANNVFKSVQNIFNECKSLQSGGGGDNNDH